MDRAHAQAELSGDALLRVRVEGMIYLVKCGDFHKIGYTSGTRADDRIKAMQTGNPYPITLVHLWPGSMEDEARWHERFGHRRTTGEWFSLTEEDVANICAVSALFDTPPTPPETLTMPAMMFEAGLKVEIDDMVGCSWCASPLLFIGDLDFLLCQRCDRKVPMKNVISNRARRTLVLRTIAEHAL